MRPKPLEHLILLAPKGHAGIQRDHWISGGCPVGVEAAGGRRVWGLPAARHGRSVILSPLPSERSSQLSREEGESAGLAPHAAVCSSQGLSALSI